MTRQTSIDVYHQIVEEGLLSPKRFAVYDSLFGKGPLTQMECCRQINDPYTQDRTFMPRFAELKRMEAIVEVGVRDCKITGRNVYIWDVTDKRPIKLEKEIKPTRKELEKRLERANLFFRMCQDVFQNDPSWPKLMTDFRNSKGLQ